jgi:hypothetical protein
MHIGRPGCRWVYNIEIILIEAGCVGMDWIDQAQDRNQWEAFLNTVKNVLVP